MTFSDENDTFLDYTNDAISTTNTNSKIVSGLLKQPKLVCTTIVKTLSHSLCSFFLIVEIFVFN